MYEFKDYSLWKPRPERGDNEESNEMEKGVFATLTATNAFFCPLQVSRNTFF